MTVNKITNPPSSLDVQSKINEIIDNLGGSGSGINAEPITQEEYEALDPPDENTLYILTTRFLVWGTAAWGKQVWGLQDE